MNLDQWLQALSAELGIDDITFDNDTVHTLLDLARDTAHEVERVAAPLSTFLVGVAVGRGETIGGASARATALAMDHESHDEAADEDSPEL